MNEDLIEMCKMFLVPATILFAAIGIARTEPLKALISAIGTGIGLLWAYRVIMWRDLSPADYNTALGLALVLAVAAAGSTVVHYVRWRNGEHEPGQV
jgi:hypothetical protein